MKFALRQLAKNPGFTAVAVLTLALGIGVNSAMFSFVNAILLKPLPYPEPERLVRLFESNLEHGWHKNSLGAPVLGEWRRQSSLFEGIAGYEQERFALTGGDQPIFLSGARVSANTFSLLGLQPMLGRDFLPDEETYGRHRVALLSSECWRTHFGSDAGIVGRNLTLNGESFQVIGIMPPRLQHPEPHLDVWTSLAFSPERLKQRHNHHYSAFGRLKPGVSIAEARSEMDVIAAQMAAADRQNLGWGIEVFSLQDTMVGNARPLLWTLLGSVGLVLLIACVNIANLQLIRSASRSKEFAVRVALGAARHRIFLQLLSESLVLALAGGIAGLFLAQLGLTLLFRFSPPDLPRISEGISLDGWTLVFTMGTSVLAGVLFGFAPALGMSRQQFCRDLNDSSRGSSDGSHRRRLRSVFVVCEVAASLMLLIGAGLMIRSFGLLLSQDLGYRSDHLVVIPVELPAKRYAGRSAKSAFFERLHQQVTSIPGVDAAALVYGLPLGIEESSLSVEIPGAVKARPGESVAAGYSQVSPGYFATLGIPLLSGREFTSQDRSNTVPALIVDETFARNFKLGANPVGRLVNVGDGTPNAEIVGLVRDVKRRDMTAESRGEMYRPYLQNCWGSMNLTLRTRRAPAEISRAVRAELDQLDKDIPIESVQTMSQLVDSAMAQRRLSVQLLGGFAGMALLLTAIGLYGVLAYNTRQRSREIGIRMALGAQRADVMNLVLREGLVLLAIGLALGLGGAFALSHLLRGLLFGVTSTDPVTYACVPFALAIVAFVACFVPARRAARVDPMEALRDS
jgi:predicted permease